VVPAVLIALVLGWQPRLALAADGQPLFLPFGWSVTLLPFVLPSMLVGWSDGRVAVMAWRALGRRSEP